MKRSFLFVTHAAAPYLSFYDAKTLTKLPQSNIEINPNGGNPPYSTSDCAFSPDGLMLAVTNTNSTPYLTVYNATDWSKISITGGYPPSNANSCAFSPDGLMLAVGHNSSPFLTVYNTTDWSKKAITGGNPASSATDCAFSPDGLLLAVTHANTPFITVYNTTDWSKKAITGGYPSGNALGCTFSPPIGGTISNADTTPITDANNVPVVRRVTALNRDGFHMLSDTQSGVDGRYELPVMKADMPVTVVFQATNDMENSVVVDWVQAE